MKNWMQLATQWPVVRRALWCALVVGAVLIAINHGDAIRVGEITQGRFVQIGLTLLVPYCVSTYSSVSAMQSQKMKDQRF
jgi:hypothetical protein